MADIQIGNAIVGDDRPCFIVAELGINHNGSLDVVKKLIDVAKSAGCNAVKFQKRTVDVVYTLEELAKPRESPFGTTNGELKRGLEFGMFEYHEINRYCREKNIMWFASCWDEASVEFIDQFGPPCYKIASACLTDDDLLNYTRSKGKPIILSTGMSSMQEVDHAVMLLGRRDLVLMHTCSTYPSAYEELNLRVMHTLRDRYRVPVGYSGHETGVPPSVAAVALGACMLERHITLDRAMWGSDQAASLEVDGIRKLVRDVRLVETAMGDGVKRVWKSEVPIQQKLRRKGGAVRVAS
jgi:N-acetylneuraminate synthase